MTLPPMIEMPKRPGEKSKPDMRYMRCALDGYIECAALTPEACICNQMPRSLYVEKYKARYGEAP